MLPSCTATIGVALNILIRRKLATEPEPWSRIIKDGTFAFASVRASDSVVTVMPEYPFDSNAFFTDCEKDSDFKNMSTEPRASGMDDLSVNIA
jgi:hypothetical protein